MLLVTVILYLIIEDWLQREFDQALESKARALMTLTEQDISGVEFNFADEYMPEFERIQKPEYFQLWIDDEHVLERSRSLGVLNLPHLSPRLPQPRFLNLELPDGHRGRLIQLDFVPQIDDDNGVDVDVPLDPTRIGANTGLHVASIAVARSREHLDAQFRTLILFLAGFVVTFLAFLAWLVAAALRIGLRPLGIVTRQIRELDAESLDARISLLFQPKELVPLLEYLNDLLERLNIAFARERALSSNLAHELRTPIAELRNLSEIGFRWPDDVSAVRQYFEDTREIANQMECIVVNLLSLSRMEAGIEMADKSRFLLASLVQGCWQDLKTQAAERTVSLHLEVADDCTVETDRDKLRLMVTNLLSNAIVHGKRGQGIRCFATQEKGCVKLTIANRSDELVESDLPYLFDRFWQKDPARSAQQHGGLGLSIVQALARLLDIEVTVGLDPIQSFHISLRIPQPWTDIR